MDIILVDSVNFNKTNKIPQLGLASLYSILQEDFDVKIIDFDYLNYKKEFEYSNNLDEDVDKMVSYLLEYKAKIYSFYTISNSYPITVLMAKKIKERNPNAKILFGGPQASVTYEDTLKAFEFVEAIGVGEGELYIKEFMKKVYMGQNLNDVKGVAYRNEKGIVLNEMPRLLTSEELNRVSILNYKEKTVYDDEGKVITIEAGRGCPCCCTFCSTSLFWNNNFRLKEITVLINEMKQLISKYGTTHIDLQHDHFTANKKNLDKFCILLIQENMPITWGCSSRIDNLQFDSIELMKKAKCRSIFVGFETGSLRMQKLIHKNLNIEKAIEKIEYIVNLGIEITTSFIFGYPEETEEDFWQTVKVIEKLYKLGGVRVQLHKYMPLPKTEELGKCVDRLYFDKYDIDCSIYNESICSQDISNMIQNHKNIFPQFYTFDSSVRKNYSRFDLFINFYTSVGRAAPYTFKYIVECVGLINVYNLMKDNIEDAYMRMNSMTVEEFYTYQNMPTIFKELYKKMIEIVQTRMNLYYQNVIKYEYLITSLDFSEDMVYEFDFDVVRLSAGEQASKQKCYFMLKKKETGVKLIRMRKKEVKAVE